MSHKETYLYLDVNGKLDQNFFQKPEIFFKIVNLQKQHPLIQIGNNVFEGTYEDHLGTKVFFVEDENPQLEDNVFVKQTPIHLKYLCKTAKTLQLKWRKMPNSVAHIDENEMLELQFTENYNKVLKKLEKGQLNIEDIAIESNKPPEKCVKNLTKPPEISEDQIKTSNPTIQLVNNTPIASTSKETDLLTPTNNSNSDVLNMNQILKKLAKEPTRQISDFQKVHEIDYNLLVNVNDAEKFSVLKQLFLQNLSLKNFDFKGDINQIDQYVDVETSKISGLTSSTNVSSLTDEQLDSLLSPKNFDNFTIPMKLTYLTEQLEAHKLMLTKMNDEELKTVDLYGRTPRHRYALLKKLTKQLWYYMYSYCADLNET